MSFTKFYGLVEQRFNRLVFRLKEMNYSIAELMDLNIINAHEQVLYDDYEVMIKRRQDYNLHGIDTKDDGFFKEFFNRYDDYFKTGIEIVAEKIEAKPLLKG